MQVERGLGLYRFGEGWAELNSRIGMYVLQGECYKNQPWRRL